MIRELRIAAIAAIALTIVLGVAYPLVMTGASRVLFPNKSDGSVVTRDGKPVGSPRTSRRTRATSRAARR